MTVKRRASSSPSSSSSAAATIRKMTSDQQKIRARLLNKLGIYQEPSPSRNATATMATTFVSGDAARRRLRLLQAHGLGPMTLSASPPDGSAVHLLMETVVPFEEPLKYRTDYVRYSSKQSSSAPSSSLLVLPNRPSKIQFQERVSVVPIPTRHEYSNRIKAKIWTNRHELAQLEQRNFLEYTAEGWNWRDAVEDDEMYLDSVSGELIHPVHVEMLKEQEHLQQEQQQQQQQQQPHFMDDDDDDTLTKKAATETFADDRTSVCDYIP